VWSGDVVHDHCICNRRDAAEYLVLARPTAATANCLLERTIGPEEDQARAISICSYDSAIGKRRYPRTRHESRKQLLGVCAAQCSSASDSPRERAIGRRCRNERNARRVTSRTARLRTNLRRDAGGGQNQTNREGAAFHHCIRCAAIVRI
jgi:hypothetical protein